MWTATSSLAGLAFLLVCLHSTAAGSCRQQCPDPGLGSVVSQQNLKLMDLIEQLQTARSQVKDLESGLQSSQEAVRKMDNKLLTTQAELGQLKSDVLKGEEKAAFRATLLKPLKANTPISFDLQFSSGGAQYDSVSGKYPVSTSGVYLFGFQLFPVTLAAMLVDLYVNGVIKIRSRCYNSKDYSTSCAASTVLRLQAGDKIWLQSNFGGKYHYGAHSFFFGTLISPVL